MRILFAALLVAFTAIIGAPARAADLPDYPQIDIPEVDYGLQGGFLPARFGRHQFAVDAGPHQHLRLRLHHGDRCRLRLFGRRRLRLRDRRRLRFDGTVDYLSNDGLTDGTNTLHLRSTVALANVYYDFGLRRSGGSAAGGWGAYVGAGLGAAYTTPASIRRIRRCPMATTGRPRLPRWRA